ncbi:hypothetical protein HPP92_010192 [Vanilla planifolia]|uniref:Uncharacterized protein n=1 Tax=Vanilla planifolia TaxID=51239 RepID=A0A835UXB1_VANPL|nr:hypothetical protein HPP92_010192 [Vanilla planifolia]
MSTVLQLLNHGNTSLFFSAYNIKRRVSLGSSARDCRRRISLAILWRKSWASAPRVYMEIVTKQFLANRDD